HVRRPPAAPPVGPRAPAPESPPAPVPEPAAAAAGLGAAPGGHRQPGVGRGGAAGAAQRVDRRVTADLAQEVGEFRLLADGRDPATGQPFGEDLAAIIDTYLSRNEPREGEAVLVFVDGALYGATPDPPPLT